jgi:FkbM family methyltransferase
MIINYHINPESIEGGSNGEGRLLEVLAPHCRNFIDVGANVGDWTQLVLFFTESECQILVFEPSESAVALLQRRFAHAPNVELVRMAAGDKEGTVEFFEEPNAGKTSSAISSFSNTQAKRREIGLTTLDVEIEKRAWPRVDFLKIDAEGYDLHVIRGASQLLSEQRIGLLQFEYNKPWADMGSTLTAAVTLLTNYGYSVFLLRANGLHPLRFHFYQEYFGYSNFVAVSPNMLSFVRGLVREEI